MKFWHYQRHGTPCLEACCSLMGCAPTLGARLENPRRMHRSLSLAGAIGFQPNRLSGLVPLNPPNVIPNDGVRGEVGKTWIVVEKRCECGSSNCPAGPRNRTDVLQPKRESIRCKCADISPNAGLESLSISHAALACPHCWSLLPRS